MSGHTLVVRLDNDGDVLLAGPAVRAVAAGSAQVTLLCGPRGRRAAALLPGVDRVVEFCAPWIDPEPPPVDARDVQRLIDTLRTLAPDRAVVLSSFHQSPLPTALLLRLAAIPRIAAVSDDYPGSLLDVRHRVPDDVHEVQRALSTVATFGFDLPAGDPGNLAVRRPARGRVHIPRPYVVVHPGASVPARAWPAERNRALVALLADEGIRVVVTGSQEESSLTAFVAGAARAEVVDLGGLTSFAELAEVLAAADAVVVGNTGPAHLAAAVGTPVVSLFAPTVPPVRWRPWGVPQELLFVEVTCRNCRARICPVEGHPCLNGVSPCDVLAALRRLAPGLPSAQQRSEEVRSRVGPGSSAEEVCT